MQITNRGIYTVCILGIVVLFFFSYVSETFAVTLSPVRVELSGDPGQTLSGEIEVYNEERQSRKFYLSYENFEPSGEDGSPKFVGRDGGVATWITAQELIELPQNEKSIVPFKLTIPASAEPGGYFGAIFFGAQNPETTGNGEVSVGGKLGTLILLTVRGDIEESAGLSSFEIEDGKRIVSKLPISFMYRVMNEGGDRIVPQGDITITNTLGMKSALLHVNEIEGSVLPSSARRFTNVWGNEQGDMNFFETVRYQWDTLHIGWYTAHARVVWGGADKNGTARYDFLIIPWHLLIVLSVIVFAFLRLLKGYNAWVIARSGK